MSDYGIDAVERALQLLDCFDDDQEAFELRELAARTGFTKPMIMRLTASMERYGYVHRGADGRYRLGPSAWRLGSRYRRQFSMEHVIVPILEDLVRETRETAVFYVRTGETRVCLFRRNSPHAARHHVEIGDRLPLGAGAAGHLLLAFGGESGPPYDEIRARGFAALHGDRDPNLSGIAAPVLRGPGDLAGALILSGLRARIEPEADRLIPVVVGAARRASVALGHRPGASSLSEAER